MRPLLSTFLFSTVLALGSIPLLNAAAPSATAQSQIAQATDSEDLYYLFQGQRIPLSSKRDSFAIRFYPGSTRGSSIPKYQQLQQDLSKGIGGTRSGSSSIPLEVRPLGTDRAIVSIPSGTRGLSKDNLERQAQAQSYVREVLPILSRTGEEEAIVLPNEIVVSFSAETSPEQHQAIFTQENLEIIRPLRFTKNRYLVRSTTATGTDILKVANRLHDINGIQSATPDFVQADAAGFQLGSGDLEPSNTTFSNTTLPSTVQEGTRLPKLQALISNNSRTASQNVGLLPLQWHLNSKPLIEFLAQNKQPHPPARTDLRATEAWQTSQGEGVVVAVLDSQIQWDHPNLIDGLYQVSNSASPLQGEQHGWDFSSDDGGDPDTRMDAKEQAIIRARLEESFLPIKDLVQRYPKQVAAIKFKYNVDDAKAVQLIRRQLRLGIIGNFHGTMSAGVITSQLSGGKGIMGVAPKAQLLPIRVGGLLEGGPSPSAVIEGLGYAVERGADVINLSFGRDLPITERVELLVQLMQDNPDLVVVASSGNENLRQAGFPSMVRGVLSVGATGFDGRRAPYSNYGLGLDIVAPGGNQRGSDVGGILTANGTFLNALWQNIAIPKQAWFPAQDPQGAYVWTQGTSFSGPAIAGVIALMKAEDPNRELTREQLIQLLKQTANYDALSLRDSEKAIYRAFQHSKMVQARSPQEFFFGGGLANAEAAVKAVQERLK